MPLFTSGFLGLVTFGLDLGLVSSGLGLVLVILVLVLRIWSCLHHWPMPPPLSHSVVKAGMVWHSGTASARLSWMLAIKLEWCNILFFMNKILFCAQYLLFIYVNIPWFFLVELFRHHLIMQQAKEKHVIYEERCHLIFLVFFIWLLHHLLCVKCGETIVHVLYLLSHWKCFYYRVRQNKVAP